MSEAEILELFSEARTSIAFLVTQNIAIHFALIAGIFLFLNRAGILIKLGVFLLYTASYASLIGLYFWEVSAYQGLAMAAAQLPSKSPAVDAILRWSSGPGELQAVSAIGLFVAGWLLILISLFTPIFRRHEAN